MKTLTIDLTERERRDLIAMVHTYDAEFPVADRTVGELCARHIGRQIILGADGETHQITGQRVRLTLCAGARSKTRDTATGCAATPTFCSPSPPERTSNARASRLDRTTIRPYRQRGAR